ncbi:hypothetical protein DFH09DRAFT_952307, partial [Mycena vulgaris]
ILNEIRFGCLTQLSIKKFQLLSREVRYDDGLAPTELFPCRKDVDRANALCMDLLTTRTEIFAARDGGCEDKDKREKLLANFMAVRRLALREGAQVMLNP